MSIRLIITINAAPGKGNDVSREMNARCFDVRAEPGCEQYELFQSTSDPDKLVLLEQWHDQATLDAHAERNSQRPPLDRNLFAGASQREDYVFNRVR